MRVVHLCNQVMEGGGTAKAVLSLHQELRSRGIDSIILVSPFRKYDLSRRIYPIRRIQRGAAGSYIGLRLCHEINRITSRMLSIVFGNWVSIPFWTCFTHQDIERYHPDIVHVHSLQDSYISLSSISRLKAPIAWTMHDLSVLQGLCHLPYRSAIVKRLDSIFLRLRLSIIAKKRIGLICPTSSMSRLADNTYKDRLQRGLDIVVIPNQVEVEKIQYAKLNEKKYNGEGVARILYGASGFLSDRNKGWGWLEKIIEAKRHMRLHCGLTVFGDDRYQGNTRQSIHSLGRRISPWHKGIEIEEFNFFFAASHFESFGILAIEAALCGLPIVCFDHTGTADVVRRFRLGRVLSPDLSNEDFINEIRKCLSLPRTRKEDLLELEKYVGSDNVVKETLEFYSRVERG